jgi:hypothetical protein
MQRGRNGCASTTRRIPMSLSKIVLVAVGLTLGLTTFASAAPRYKMANDIDYNETIPGKVQQDRFTVTN